MTPAQWQVTEALIDTGTGDQERPTAHVQGDRAILAFDGFTKVAGVYTRFDEQILPKLDQWPASGAAGSDADAAFHEPAAALFSEARLVKALESEGIGRPSHVCVHHRDHSGPAICGSKGRTLYATDLGIKVTEKLIEGFPDMMDTALPARSRRNSIRLRSSTRIGWRWCGIFMSRSKRTWRRAERG